MTQLPHDDIILARIGEITLKGLNRGKFEQRLQENISRRLKKTGRFVITCSQSRIWIEPNEPIADLPAVLRLIADVFGVVSVSPVWRFSGGLEELKDQAIAAAACWIENRLSGIGLKNGKMTFKIESRRGDKRYPLTSPEISALIGETLLDAFPDVLAVDVHHPDFILYVEIREQMYLYTEIVKGSKGLPVGTGGRGMLLLSGGIDSPVAGYMMASRGMELDAIYFHAFPFTSDQAKEKVLELGRILTTYTGRLTVHVVNFTDIQLMLRDRCPADMMTIVMRRMMMRIAEQLAVRRNCKALITGESLGQVASQTLEALNATDQVVTMPVFRPLIGLDKDDTITLARRIGTYETSILPFEDCCTIFVARHPKTHPRPDDAAKSEESLDIDALVAAGLDRIEEVSL